MILQCPNCESKFRINPAILGSSGKKVRCSSCQYTWFQAAPEEQRKVETPPPPADLSPAHEDAPPRTDDAPMPDFKKREQPAEEAPPRRRAGLYVWGAFAAMLVILVVARDSVVGLWEPTALFYETVGLEVPVTGQGLGFENVKVEPVDEDGSRKWIITGFIVNNTDSRRDIPPLKAELKNARHQTVSTWTFSAEKDRILSIESQPFRTEIESASTDATAVVITFASSN